MENHEKEVYFDLYCPTCKHANLPEDEEPCHDCMNYPSNTDSHKPVRFEEP